LSVPGGCFFRVGSAYFKAPITGEERDFGGSIGRCVSARRCDIDLDEDRLNPAPVGDREWVQVKRIVLDYGVSAWRTEKELREHLYETEFS
jgi:hypothetical protein